jgi:hypothetical protein
MSTMLTERGLREGPTGHMLRSAIERKFCKQELWRSDEKSSEPSGWRRLWYSSEDHYIAVSNAVTYSRQKGTVGIGLSLRAVRLDQISSRRPRAAPTK